MHELKHQTIYLRNKIICYHIILVANTKVNTNIKYPRQRQNQDHPLPKSRVGLMQ